MKENLHVQAIPEDVLNQVQTKFEEALTLLKPYLLSLTPAQRRELPKLGEKTLEFVEKSLQYAQANPALCPAFLNLSDFETDMKDVQRLWAPLNKAEQAFREIEDTLTVAGSEAYQAALLFYKYVKLLAEQSIPGAETIYGDLKSRFTGGHKSAKTE
jgi:hypothetical protein